MPFDPYFSPPPGWAPESAGLTINQLAGIGFVMWSWAGLESIYQHTLFVLAKSPDMLGQALTEDLSPDNRSKALKRLCQTWKLILHPDHWEEQRKALSEAERVGKWIDSNKAERNKIAHWNWLRVDDEKIFGFKYHLKPINLTDNRARGITRTHEELFAFGAKINEHSGALLAIQPALDKLPPWPDKQA